jgi:hypothetical protein
MALAKHSGLGYYQWLIAKLMEHGYGCSIPRHYNPQDCIRVITGLELAHAGAFADTAVVLGQIQREQGRELPVTNDETIHTALSELVAGNSVPLQAILTSHYRLHYRLNLALDQHLTLLLKADASFIAQPGGETHIPKDWLPKPKRLGRSEYKVLLERAASGALRR